MRPVETTARIADESGPLPQFSIFDLDAEPDELTVRRDFSPKTPPRVAIDVSDADATWKWQRPRADQIGKFTGIALPLLDGEQAIEFDPDEVEVTREMVSPFAMREVAKALELRRRPRRPVGPSARGGERHKSLAIGACAVLAVALVAVIAFVMKRSHAPIPLGYPPPALVAAPVLELPPIPAPTTGSIVPSVKGHRLYVDGKLVGDSGGPLTIPCGPHTIKLGSGGASKLVSVPCGGEVTISP